MVIKDSKPVVAQYGQWDGYPSGQGVTILNFLKTHDMAILAKQLEKVRFANDEDNKKKEEFFKSIGCKDGWMNGDQAVLYHKEYPYASRDIGGEILEMIYNSTDEEIVLVDSSNFANDSLFCEWGYVVNLDTMQLEVYKGFISEQPETPDTRFGNVKSDSEEKYYPIQPCGIFDIDRLPEEADFVEACDPPEPEEGEEEVPES